MHIRREMHISKTCIPNDKEKRECKNRIKSSRHSIRFNCSELKQYSLKESISIVGSRVCIGLLSQLMSLKRNKLK